MKLTDLMCYYRLLVMGGEGTLRKGTLRKDMTFRLRPEKYEGTTQNLQSREV